MPRLSKKDIDKEKRIRRLKHAFDAYSQQKKIYEESLQSNEPLEKPLIRKTAKRFNISYDFLRRRISTGVAVDAKPGRPPLLTIEEENELKNWIFEMSDRRFAISRVRVIQMATQMVAAKCRKKGKQIKPLTARWWRGFKGRHPDVVKRRTDELQNARGEALVYKRVKHFYDSFKDVIENYNIDPSRLWNADECGIQIDAPLRETFTKKGRKKVHVKTTGNRTLITLMGCGSATGNSIPPALVFPGKKLTKAMLKGAPTGTVAMCTENGYFTAKAFKQYLDHFAKHSRPTEQSPVLLVIDGFAGHIDADVLSHAKKLNILIECFPSHSTHALQPMDVGIFSSFKSYYRRRYAEWIEKHSDQKLLKEDFASLMCEPFYMAFRALNLISAFSATGLYPMEPEKAFIKCRVWKEDLAMIEVEQQEYKQKLKRAIDNDQSDTEDEYSDSEIDESSDEEDDSKEQEEEGNEEEPIDEDFLITEFTNDLQANDFMNNDDDAVQIVYPLSILAEAVSQTADQSQNTSAFADILVVPSSNQNQKRGKKRKVSVLATEHFLTQDNIIETLTQEKEGKRKKKEEQEEKKKEKERKKKAKEEEKIRKNQIKDLIKSGEITACRCRSVCSAKKRPACRCGNKCGPYCNCPCKKDDQSQTSTSGSTVLDDTPSQSSSHCINCDQPIENIAEALRCNDCHGMCHQKSDCCVRGTYRDVPYIRCWKCQNKFQRV